MSSKGSAAPLKDTKCTLRFLHIPKNAGTAIENVALQNGIFWGWWDPGPRAGRAGSHCPCSAVHTLPQDLTRNVYKDGPTFAVVRNPYDRIVSEYNYRCRCGGMEEPSKSGLNQFVATALAKPEEEMRLLFDCHLVPQYAYLRNKDGTSNVTDIVRCETLDKDLTRIGRKYNLAFLQSPIPHKNKSPITVTSQDLNAASIMLVNQYYKKDFEQLGYQLR